MCALDVLQMRVTAEEFNDTKKCGPYGELFFFLMCRETDPIEAVPFRHVSTGQGALGGFPWPRASGPHDSEAAFFGACGACTHQGLFPA